MPLNLSASALSELSASFEDKHPSEVIAWGFSTFGDACVVASSFQDCVLIDLVAKHQPSAAFIFLDTGSHFPETLSFVEEIRSRYDLNLTITHPVDGAKDWPCGSPQCCAFRKVEPLKRAVHGKQAWMTAVKRIDATTRVETAIVSMDPTFGLIKINPLATWSDGDIDDYVREQHLPIHPLVSKGYLSIGCAPTTRPVAPGEHPRAGRFVGMGKTECGLHPPSPTVTTEHAERR